MPVPEAAMDEDRLLSSDIGNVRVAWDVLAMDPIAWTDGTRQFPYDQFRPGIARTHRAHNGRAVNRLLFLALSFAQRTTLLQELQSDAPQANADVLFALRGRAASRL